jgi:AmiR/NasT family two-component response regulator
VVIEQAKGYLARRHGVSPEEAFGKIRAAARRSQRRLTAVAEDVVRRGLEVD